MKVLHVIDALGVGGGAEHSLITMLPEYIKGGIENTVACLHARPSGLFEDVLQMGIPYHVVEGSSISSKALHLRALIKDVRPDIVHATLVKSSITTRLACFGLPVRQLHSFVNTTYDESKVALGGVPAWKLNMVRLIDMGSAKLIRGRFHAITEAVAEEMVRELRIPRHKIDVVPRSRSAANLGRRTETRRRDVRSRMGCDEDDIVVLNVGRQDWIKAQDVVIRGFDTAALSELGLHLWIAGREGNASSSVQRALSSAAASHRIRLLGHRTDVADLIVAADILVAMSHHEGFGGVLLEAMALECPIVASDAACFREVLNEGELGMLTPRGDVAHLGASLIRLASDQELRQRLASLGLAAFERRFTLSSVTEQMIAVYRRTLDERDSHPTCD